MFIYHGLAARPEVVVLIDEIVTDSCGLTFKTALGNHPEIKYIETESTNHSVGPGPVGIAPVILALGAGFDEGIAVGAMARRRTGVV